MPDPIVQQPGAAVIPTAPVTPTPAKDGGSQTPAAQTPGASQTTPAQPKGQPSTPAQTPQMVPITALHEERDKRQQLQQELEALRTHVNTPVAPVQPIPQQQQNNDIAKELDKLWETDPRKAVQAEIYTAMTWRDNLDAAVDMQINNLTSRYPEATNYSTEVRQYIRSLPLNQRGMPGVADLAYYVVRGQKVDSIISSTRSATEADMLRRMQEGSLAAAGQAPGAMSGGGATPGSFTLTVEEKAVADAMGMSEADYAKNKKV